MQKVPVLLIRNILFVFEVPFLSFFEDVEELRGLVPAIFPGSYFNLRVVTIKPA
jgi:hypothetical protein